VCSLVKDALLVEAPLNEIDEVVLQTLAIMQEAGEIVLEGCPFRSDADIIRFPERYGEPRQGDAGESNANLTEIRTGGGWGGSCTTLNNLKPLRCC